MKAVKLWKTIKNNPQRYDIVKKEKKNYMPTHYEKGSVCINGTYIFTPKHIKTHIKKVSKITEDTIKKIEKDKEKAYELISVMNTEIQELLKHEFKGVK